LWNTGQILNLSEPQFPPIKCWKKISLNQTCRKVDTCQTGCTYATSVNSSAFPPGHGLQVCLQGHSCTTVVSLGAEYPCGKAVSRNSYSRWQASGVHKTLTEFSYHEARMHVVHIKISSSSYIEDALSYLPHTYLTSITWIENLAMTHLFSLCLSSHFCLKCSY
jgi:hypothetical protein